MSSYINSPMHFNSVGKKLEGILIWKHDDFFFPYKLKYIYPKLYESGVLPEEKEEIIRGIMDTLKILQATCVILQYAHHYAGAVDNQIESEIDYLMKGKECTNITIHGLYNLIRCIGYQIETEHLKELRELTEDENNAIGFIEIISNAIAHHLVRKMPEDKITWSL